MKFQGFKSSALELGGLDVFLSETRTLIPLACASCAFTCATMETLDCGHTYCNRCAVKLNEIDHERYCLSCWTISRAIAVRVDETFVRDLPCRCPRCQDTFRLGRLRTHFSECILQERESGNTQRFAEFVNSNTKSSSSTENYDAARSTPAESKQQQQQQQSQQQRQQQQRQQRHVAVVTLSSGPPSYDTFYSGLPVKWESKLVTLGGMTVYLRVEQYNNEASSTGVQLCVDNWGSDPRMATFAVTCKDNFIEPVDETTGRPTGQENRGWRSFVKISPQGAECPPALFSNTRINMIGRENDEVSIALELVE